MKVPFLELTAQNDTIRDELLARWATILDTARYVSGSHVDAFEAAFAEAHGVDHCVAVSNGTVALELPLRALGIGPGDEVVVPANTFIATAEAVSNVGATPYFVDIDPRTCNIDPAALAAALERPTVVGAMVVHLYGQPADLAAIGRACDAAGKWFIEDAAQAHLARYKGTPVGSFGICASFSFYPGKNLGAPGEAGAVLTNDSALAADLRALRDHGQDEKYHSRLVGTNARMAEFLAAALDLKLPLLPEWTEARRMVAARYTELLRDVPGIDLLHVLPEADPVWHLYVIHTDDRDALQQHLAELGIGSGLHYPVPLHLQRAYAAGGAVFGALPHAEASARRLLSLPMFAELSDAQIAAVVDGVAEWATAR